MKKGSKEMLKTIISNQELIMKALKIEVPVKVVEKMEIKKVSSKKPIAKKDNKNTTKVAPIAAKRVVGKPAVKKAK